MTKNRTRASRASFGLPACFGCLSRYDTFLSSGKKVDHAKDRGMIEEAVLALTKPNSKAFAALVASVYATSIQLYPDVHPDVTTSYVVENASRANLIVLNSERDKQAAGDNPTEPSSPFTIIIGGNIVSRGVTFPNLLAMFFTRDVQHKMQQDTYIQRARMFGARGAYLKHFELTIPTQLYADWHRCFLFHRLALKTIGTELGSPIWIGDSRISVASSPSIDKATVTFDKGEMSFGMFTYTPALDALVSGAPESMRTLEALRKKVGDSALPPFLIQFITDVMAGDSGTLAIHTASSIAGYKTSADHETISRTRGFMGAPQLEKKKYPSASHHIKIFYNGKGKAKLFYKFKGKLKFIHNQASKKVASTK